MVTIPIGVAFNVKGVTDLTLTPDVVAKIFQGKITTWNDPAIKALNSGANLPSTKITVFFRSDESGTTQNFERYLAASAPTDIHGGAEQDLVGEGRSGQVEVATTVCSRAIKSVDGGVGYLEWSFVVQWRAEQREDRQRWRRGRDERRHGRQGGQRGDRSSAPATT